MRQTAILLIIFSCFLLTICAAQETITITTYYPSPFGSYDSLSANNFQADRIAIGNANTAADPASANYVGDGVLDFVGLGANPVGNAGSIYYNSVSNTFLYHNGAGWLSMVPEPARLILYAQDALPHLCQPAGTHVVAVLDTMFRGANLATPPANGYIVCH